MDEKTIGDLIADITGTAQAIFANCDNYEEAPTFSRQKLGATLQVCQKEKKWTLGTEIQLPKPADLKLSTGEKTVACITSVTNEPDLNGGRIPGTHEQKITLNKAVDDGSNAPTKDVTVSWNVNADKAGESVATKLVDKKGERLIAKASTTGVSASYTTVSASCTGISIGATGLSYSVDFASFNFTLMRVLTRGAEVIFTLKPFKTKGADQSITGVNTAINIGKDNTNSTGEALEASGNK